MGKIMGAGENPGERAQMESFYKTHRGGTGAVIVVKAYDQSTNESSTAVFSSLEKAQAFMSRWADDEDVACLVMPYVVDEPDWGNGRVN